ncbi:protein RGF1 INDUCIBLE TRANSCRIPTION FACTOR 1-like [Magnolia sinica]|uniref:protein RGF1 INDUCIBLE TRANSCRIPTION FACTOR 1-like n=1 Tax=Magnolia sinica TaxID=86752 RepID=UPI0026583148|nr:protein RGF1 INDUCIBLE TRANSCRIPTION FACTOR 1-like [Magnolia sinica]
MEVEILDVLEEGNIEKKKLVIPSWLKVMLSTNFSNVCILHSHTRRHEFNYFCINCSTSICSLCLVEHSEHKYLQIRKYIYCHVVNLRDIRKLFDCSGVQTFTSNGRKVVFLKEKPTSQTKIHTSNTMTDCVCERSLQDSLYCSLACKVLATSSDRENENKPTPPSSPNVEENTTVEENPIHQRLRLGRYRRKGVPLRSPLK